MLRLDCEGPVGTVPASRTPQPASPGPRRMRGRRADVQNRSRAYLSLWSPVAGRANPPARSSARPGRLIVIRPSCGSRRSAMSRPARILMRDAIGICSALGGEQPLSRCPDEFTERLLNLRRQWQLRRLRGRDDLRGGYLLHGGPPVLTDLVWRPRTLPTGADGAGRTASNFYELPDNLKVAKTATSLSWRKDL